MWKEVSPGGLKQSSIACKKKKHTKTERSVEVYLKAFGKTLHKVVILLWTASLGYGASCCSPSDLDADDEDNQEYDSAVTQSDGGRLTEGPPALLSPRPWAGESNDQEEAGNNPQHRALGGTMVQEAERVQEEVRRLVQLLKEKELRIHSLERRVLAMAKELSEVTAENRELREMNNALLDGVPLAMQPPAKE
ncbi:hypothetical protein V5799_024224 [Amblyomma americanum]|uniref:Uncharacterized protein n=1 Tax=Amblyomma americanum TaxID=6943 RepID=A0AAQ4ED77_AMBAM